MITPKVIYKSKLGKMTEILGANFESNENLPKLKQASPEEVQKVGEEIKYSNHLKKVNDVLNILDYPDNIEEKFRKILNEMDDKTLIELSNQSKENIKTFILNKKEETTINTKKTELKEQNIESKKFDSKISKIKSVFTPEILSKNSDIADKLKVLDSLDNPLEKEKVLKDILELLKEPGKLKSIVDDLGGADKNNLKYLEFKESLIGIDSNFENYFNDIENINSKDELNTNEIVGEIQKESGGLETIDLNSSSPVSKLSLEGSDYSFDEKINKQALGELMNTSENRLKEIQNSITILKGIYTPFDGLLSNIKEHWGKQDFKESLKTSVNSFPSDIFGDLNKLYENMDIESNIQLNQSDILSLANIENPNDLRQKIDNIKNKLTKIKSQILERKDEILKKHKTNVKELLQKKEEAEEKQLEVLQFMKDSGYDLLPKDISNKIIRDLQSNTLTIPGLNLSVQNIDLKNGHFGESSAFIDQNGGINTMAKKNIVKFMNKLISGDIKEPLSVEGIANGVGVVNPTDLKNKFLEAGIINGLGWKYSRMVENLKSKK